MKTMFQRHDVAAEFLDRRRKAIPYAADQLQMMLRVVEHYVPNVSRLADLGCGDGILARTIMDAFPSTTAVLIDHSHPMLERAAVSMKRFAHRFTIAQRDLMESIVPLPYVKTVDLVVSGFAIHHLPSERKQSLYAEIFDVLEPGGMFINLEHVAPPSHREEELFDDVYIENIADATGLKKEEVAADYHSRPDKVDNILESPCVQMQWLQEIGFTDVDCYFKFLELAMFGGVKP